MQQTPDLPEFVTQFIDYCEYHQPGWLVEWEEVDGKWKWCWYDTYSLEHIPPKKGGVVLSSIHKGKHIKKGLLEALYNKMLEQEKVYV